MISPQPDPTASNAAAGPTEGTFDPAEVERFGKIAAEWWDPQGKFRPLHQIGPARLMFIREQVSAHFPNGDKGLRPLRGLSVLDVGCGGGLIAEPLARLGGQVTAIDPAPETIAAARAHALALGLDIDYRAARLEDLAGAGERFDVVTCLEVLEHVPDPGAFVRLLAAVVAPGGIMILSTINRTLKAYALAIVGAEYVLRWLPPGTHRWERFITPQEMMKSLDDADFATVDVRGLVFSPLSDRWTLGRDVDVNYIISAAPRRT